VKKHILKAELTTEQKFALQAMASENKRSVKRQTEWILVKELDKYRNQKGKTDGS